MGGPEGNSAHFICGFLGWDARALQPAAGGSAPRHSDQQSHRRRARGVCAVRAWRESKGPRMGAQAVLSRLSELMFVDVVRRYLRDPAGRTEPTGWRALRDPFVGRALAAFHRNPSRAWTLESLARTVGLSRSALTEALPASSSAIHPCNIWRAGGCSWRANYLLSRHGKRRGDRRPGSATNPRRHSAAVCSRKRSACRRGASGERSATSRSDSGSAPLPAPPGASAGTRFDRFQVSRSKLTAPQDDRQLTPVIDEVPRARAAPMRCTIREFRRPSMA